MDNWDIFWKAIAIIATATTSWLFYLLTKSDSKKQFRELVKLVNSRKLITLSEAFLLTRILAGMIKTRINYPEYKLKVILAISPGGGMIAEWLSRTFIGTYEDPIPVYTIPMNYDIGHLAVDDSKFLVTYLKNRFKLDENDTILLVNDHSRIGTTWHQAIDSLGAVESPHEPSDPDDAAPSYRIKDGPKIICASVFCTKDIERPASFFITNLFVVDASRNINFEWKELPKGGEAT
ncbi:MAG: hypothetical protein GY785_02255 [Gammaproteobacteria bacterium]|nr:hypothetical protein [Gammaproteobacteria bacterium]